MEPGLLATIVPGPDALESARLREKYGGWYLRPLEDASKEWLANYPGWLGMTILRNNGDAFTKNIKKGGVACSILAYDMQSFMQDRCQEHPSFTIREATHPGGG